MVVDELGPDAWADLIDACVRCAAVNLEGLSPHTVREVSEVLGVVDLLWEAAYRAPPLKEDRLALALGLVPDPARALSGVAVERALWVSGLTACGLARCLSLKGWDVTPGDVSAWCSGNTASVPPALIAAVATELGVAVDCLVMRLGS